MKLYLTIITSILIILGGTWTILLKDNATYTLMFFVDIFSCLTAIVTIFAAYIVYQSAKISEKASSIWTQNISLDIELNEAKDLKASLNTWHRKFLSEACSKNLTLNGLDKQIFANSRSFKQTLIGNFKQYIDDLEHNWLVLEASFDKTSFIEHDSEYKLRLRKRHQDHKKAVNEYVEYLTFKSQTPLSKNEITPILTTIYKITDWEEQEINLAPIYRVPMETKNNAGRLEPCLKDDGSEVFVSLHQSIDSLMHDINTAIDKQIKNIKSKLEKI